MEKPAEALLYVNCLLQSLARYLILLTESGRRVECLEFFDFYPQTFHSEAPAGLRR